MSKLTTQARKAIPAKDFALPGRRYPIENRSHAANAKARVSQFGTSAEKAAVDKAVARKYPDMGTKGHSGHYGMKSTLHHRGGKSDGYSHNDE